MHCRQPLEFLSFFHPDSHPRATDSNGGDGTATTTGAAPVEALSAGAYMVPTFCEYCGAAHLSQCRRRRRRWGGHQPCRTDNHDDTNLDHDDNDDDASSLSSSQESYCSRPVLFFAKKRPPFCKPDPWQWDDQDEWIEPPPPSSSTTLLLHDKGDEENRIKSMHHHHSQEDPLHGDALTTKSWVSGLFGSHGD